MRYVLPLLLTLVSGLATAKEPLAGDAATRADLYAGSLLVLDGVAEDLAEAVARTRDRHLVWKGRIALGLKKHKVDWNPALGDLHKLLERDVPDWIDEVIEDAAALWKEGHQRKQERREEQLAAEVSRIATVLELAAQDLGCIHASQFALHEAPATALGQGLGFTNGVIEHTDRLWVLLQAGRKKAPPGWHEESARAVEAAQRYVEGYFDGLEEGARLLQVSEVAGLVTMTLGVGEVLLGLRALVAEVGGGGGMVAAGAGGGAMVMSGELTLETARALAAVMRGGSRAALSGVLLRGGREPVEIGRAGERAAGMPEHKKRVEWPERSGKYIVPDKVTEVTIEEVKNVAYLSRTRQLLKYLDYAQKTKRTFTLWVRPGTKIAKELQKLIRVEQILRRDIP
jgi:restriction endonuclease fold toxin 7 of polymorphic toxin system